VTDLGGAAVHGVHEVIAALERLAVEAAAASVRIVQRGQVVVEAEAKRQFTGEHKKGTPTTSSPGSPPDVVTGTLRRSIRSDQPSPVGAFGASGRVYPTAIYARIMELGGETWNGGFLPPRPYMQPAYLQAFDQLEAIAADEWRRSIH
jgi:hypothetical protein